MKLLETYFTHDINSFHSYASVWAKIPACLRDQDKPNLSWYGWLDYTICPECYHNYAQNFPAMVNQMELRYKVLPNSAMCEMYSPRMRNLYAQCAASGELEPLLKLSVHRRMVYMQMVPQMHMMIFEAKMNLGSSRWPMQ